MSDSLNTYQPIIPTSGDKFATANKRTDFEQEKSTGEGCLIAS